MKKTRFQSGGFAPLLLFGLLTVGGALCAQFTVSPPAVTSASLQSNAHQAMHDQRFVSEKGMCSKFSRQVTEAEYALKYRDLFGASALVTMENFKRAKRGFYPSELLAHDGLWPGDFLFKGKRSGQYGHVGIYVGSDLVAENSSTSIGRVSGAKGYRTLRQYGVYDYVGRLPGNTGPRLVLSVVRGPQQAYFRLPGAELHNGSFEIDRDVLAGILKTKGRAARVPLRETLAALGFRVVKTGDHRRDKTDPRVYVFVTSK